MCTIKDSINELEVKGIITKAVAEEILSASE
jgi:hypothetical protein